MNNLTEYRDEKLLHHDLIAKRQEVRRLSIEDATADTEQFEPIEFGFCDRFQMAIQGQPLWIIGLWCFLFVTGASLVAALIGHLFAVACGAPGLFS